MCTIIDNILGSVEKLKIEKTVCYGIESSNPEKTFKSNENIEVVACGLYSNKDPQKGDYRYRLDIEIKNKKNDSCDKRLIVLLMNPSNTYPKTGFDYTIENIIRIAYKMKYKRIIVFNSSPYIDGNSDTQICNNCLQPDEDYKKMNTDYIVNQINRLSEDIDFMLAWGGNKNKVTNEQEYLKAIFNFFNKKNARAIINVYRRTKNKPCHASIRVQNKYGYISDFLKNKNSFEPLEIIKLKSSDIYKLRIPRNL